MRLYRVATNDEKFALENGIFVNAGTYWRPSAQVSSFHCNHKRFDNSKFYFASFVDAVKFKKLFGDTYDSDIFMVDLPGEPEVEECGFGAYYVPRLCDINDYFALELLIPNKKIIESLTDPALGKPLMRFHRDSNPDTYKFVNPPATFHWRDRYRIGERNSERRRNGQEAEGEHWDQSAYRHEINALVPELQDISPQDYTPAQKSRLLTFAKDAIKKSAQLDDELFAMATRGFKARTL